MRTLALLLLFCSSYLSAQVVNFPDQNFLAALIADGVDTNNDSMIQVDEAEKRDSLLIDDKSIVDLGGIESFVHLKHLNCKNNKLSVVNFSQNSELEFLDITNNNLAELDLSANDNISELKCGYNGLGSLDLRNLIKLKRLDCYNNQIDKLNLEFCTLLERMNVDNSGISEIDLSRNLELNWVSVRRNNLAHLDVSHNIFLETLLCADNRLTKLELQPLDSLRVLNCSENLLSELDVTNNTLLEVLHSTTNMLTELDLSFAPMLNLLNISDNLISEMDLSSNRELSTLYIDKLELTELNLSSNLLLESLKCSENHFVALDLSQQESIFLFDAYLPGLEFLNLVNNGDDILLFDLELDSITQLTICVDTQEEADDIKSSPFLAQRLDQLSFLLDCSFPLELLSYSNRFSGKIRYDEKGECDSDSEPVENYLDLRINNDKPYTLSGFDAGGLINVPMPDGTYTVDFLVNQQLFKVEPQSIAVSLAGNETITQDVCLSPGTFLSPDVSMDIIPLSIPRPGFVAEYKIIFKNQGNVAADGQLYLQFDTEQVDYQSSDPDMELNGNVLLYKYSKLLPFEEREILLFFELNSPMDMPPLNNGDLIRYRGSISAQASSRQADDLVILEQVVVNSYDPNDKTCLQGTAVLDTTLGQYLDYMIRFENTGTAEAVNVKIEDKIDTTVFDIHSLQVVDASHEVVTLIEGNKVSFLFSDIYLPFDDDNNDGYVVFELKTLETLELNADITNSANIFFDFNFPITTNTYISRVATDMDGDGFHNLEDCDDDNPTVYPGAVEVAGNAIDEDCNGELLSGTKDVEQVSPFRIYPNPAKDIVYLEYKQSADYTIKLAGIDGRILLLENNVQFIDLHAFETGLYVLSLWDRGTARAYHYRLIVTR